MNDQNNSQSLYYIVWKLDFGKEVKQCGSVVTYCLYSPRTTSESRTGVVAGMIDYSSCTFGLHGLVGEYTKDDLEKATRDTYVSCLSIIDRSILIRFDGWWMWL